MKPEVLHAPRLPDGKQAPVRSPHRGLIWALMLSVAVHLALVTLRFAAPQTYNRVFQDTPLEVILVNARSQESPREAQAMAQVRLAGGGEVAQVRIASSPLPPALNQNPGTDISAVQRQIEAMKVQQMRLLTQLKQELSVLSRENAGDRRDQPDRQQRQEPCPWTGRVPEARREREAAASSAA